MVCSLRQESVSERKSRNRYAVLLQETLETSIFFPQAPRLSKSRLEVQQLGIRFAHGEPSAPL